MTKLINRVNVSGKIAAPLVALLLSASTVVPAMAQDAAPVAGPSMEVTASATPSDAASTPAPAAAGTPTENAVASMPPSGDVPAPAAPAPAAPAMVDNPYGLGALWANGDIIARGVLVIMVIMSLGSWYIILTKLFEQNRIFGAAKDAVKNFWTKQTLHEGSAALKQTSPFRYIADTGIVAAEHHEGTMQESIDLSDWTSSQIQRAVDRVQSDLQGGLAFLGTVGSTSPFVGLFGTVWGIYHALTAIGIAGQASIDKVAGPVGESLIMTAIGLATAVPAVLGYNLLVRRNKGAMEEVRGFAADLQSVLIGGLRHGAARPTVSLRPDNSPTTTTVSDRVA